MSADRDDADVDAVHADVDGGVDRCNKGKHLKNVVRRHKALMETSEGIVEKKEQPRKGRTTFGSMLIDELFKIWCIRYPSYVKVGVWTDEEIAYKNLLERRFDANTLHSMYTNASKVSILSMYLKTKKMRLHKLCDATSVNANGTASKWKKYNNSVKCTKKCKSKNKDKTYKWDLYSGSEEEVLIHSPADYKHFNIQFWETFIVNTTDILVNHLCENYYNNTTVKTAQDVKQKLSKFRHVMENEWDDHDNSVEEEEKEEGELQEEKEEDSSRNNGVDFIANLKSTLKQIACQEGIKCATAFFMDPWVDINDVKNKFEHLEMCTLLDEEPVTTKEDEDKMINTSVKDQYDKTFNTLRNKLKDKQSKRNNKEFKECTMYGVGQMVNFMIVHLEYIYIHEKTSELARCDQLIKQVNCEKLFEAYKQLIEKCDDFIEEDKKVGEELEGGASPDKEDGSDQEQSAVGMTQTNDLQYRNDYVHRIKGLLHTAMKTMLATSCCHDDTKQFLIITWPPIDSDDDDNTSHGVNLRRGKGKGRGIGTARGDMESESSPLSTETSPADSDDQDNDAVFKDFVNLASQPQQRAQASQSQQRAQAPLAQQRAQAPLAQQRAPRAHISSDAILRIHGSEIRVIQGDILKIQADIIVNASNPGLTFEGEGIHRVIRDAADPGIHTIRNRKNSIIGVVKDNAYENTLTKYIDDYKLKQSSQNLELMMKSGFALVTSSFGLKSDQNKTDFIIHIAGPNCGQKNGISKDVAMTMLTSCITNAIFNATKFYQNEEQVVTLSIPAISMGIYKCDIPSATETIINACINAFTPHNRSFIINLVVLKRDNVIYKAYLNALQKARSGTSSEGFPRVNYTELLRTAGGAGTNISAPHPYHAPPIPTSPNTTEELQSLFHSTDGADDDGWRVDDAMSHGDGLSMDELLSNYDPNWGNEEVLRGGVVGNTGEVGSIQPVSTQPSISIEPRLPVIENIVFAGRFGAASSNGFVDKVREDTGNGTFSVYVLKSCKKESADNLMYEYFAGQYINNVLDRFNYKCFLRTYALLEYTSDKQYENVLKQNNIAEQKITKYLKLHTAANFKTAQFQEACKEPKHMAILIEAVGSEHAHSYSLRSMLKQHSNTDGNTVLHFVENYMLEILLQIYIPLVQLRDEFTHYDLHADNVLLVETSPPCKFTFTVEDQLVSFESKYTAVLIDYGRSFFKQPNSIKSSKYIYDLVCNTKECNTNGGKCGNKVGFGWLSELPMYSSKHYYINSTYANNSHDLRLLSIVRSSILDAAERRKQKQKPVDNIQSNYPKTVALAQLLSGVVYLGNFGTPPASSDPFHPQRVMNIVDARDKLIALFQKVYVIPSLPGQTAVADMLVEAVA